MKCTRAHAVLCIITTVLVVVLDLGTKTWWFETTDHHNFGLLFDIPAPPWLIVGVSVAVLAAVLANYGRRMLVEPRIAIAVGLLAGGAMGNGYDRVMFGFVRDWILLFERSAFNIADVAIGLGIVLLATCSNRLPSSHEP